MIVITLRLYTMPATEKTLHPDDVNRIAIGQAGLVVQVEESALDVDPELQKKERNVIEYALDAIGIAASCVLLSNPPQVTLLSPRLYLEMLKREEANLPPPNPKLNTGGYTM